MPAKKKITKKLILSTALSMLEKDGYDAINVKTLAAELGCSTQPIYLSFANMDDLRQALSQAAVQKFIERIGDDGSLYGMPYIRFAKNNKNLFCFLFMRENAYVELKPALSPVIERSVQNLMQKYHLSHEEAEWKHDQVWMHSHGIASMIATDFCDWDMSKVEAMVREMQDNVFQQ
jgi:AcrR family transcriptional regulator